MVALRAYPELRILERSINLVLREGNYQHLVIERCYHTLLSIVQQQWHTYNSLFTERNMENPTCCSRCTAAACISGIHPTKTSTSSTLSRETRLYSRKSRLQTQIKPESYTLVLPTHQTRTTNGFSNPTKLKISQYQSRMPKWQWKFGDQTLQR